MFYCLVAEKPEDGFHLDLEDYLMGVLTLTSELVSCSWFQLSDSAVNICPKSVFEFSSYNYGIFGIIMV